MVLEVSQVLLVDLFGSERFGPTKAVGTDYLRAVSTFSNDQDGSPPAQFTLVGPAIAVIWNDLVGDEHTCPSLLVL